MKADTQNHIRFKLQLCEWFLRRCPGYDTYYYTWKRRYLIQRLLALQIKEFDRESSV